MRFLLDLEHCTLNAENVELKLVALYQIYHHHQPTQEWGKRTDLQHYYFTCSRIQDFTKIRREISNRIRNKVFEIPLVILCHFIKRSKIICFYFKRLYLMKSKMGLGWMYYTIFLRNANIYYTFLYKQRKLSVISIWRFFFFYYNGKESFTWYNWVCVCIMFCIDSLA